MMSGCLALGQTRAPQGRGSGLFSLQAADAAFFYCESEQLWY